MKPALTIDELVKSAYQFCEIESHRNHNELIGITDGKAIGTYIEHKFQRFFQSKYTIEMFLVMRLFIIILRMKFLVIRQNKDI